jgi:hypothetical protein
MGRQNKNRKFRRMNRSQENADPSAYIDEFDIQAIVKVSFEWEIVKMFKNAHKQKSLTRGYP